MVHLYFDSRTGNVRRFIDWTAQRITEDPEAREPGHLVTYTTKIGHVPESTRQFMNEHSDRIYSVTSSGNRNWGTRFGLAADIIADDYDVPLAMKFELSGTMEDISQFIDIIKNYYNDSKRSGKKLDIA